MKQEQLKQNQQFVGQQQSNRVANQFSTLQKSSQTITLQQIPMNLKFLVMICSTALCSAINGVSFIRNLSQSQQQIYRIFRMKTFFRSQMKSQMYFDMFRYNSVLFGSKIYFDVLFKNQIHQAQKNKNFLIHYKIGGLTGISTYFINSFFDHVKMTKNKHISYNFLTGTNSKLDIKVIFDIIKGTLKKQNIKQTINRITFLGVIGTALYRCIYFGIYQKMRRQFQHPINEYLIAPIFCTALSFVTLPIDNIRFFQMKEKQKSIIDIIEQRNISLLEISRQKVLGSFFRQSLGLSLFMMGQKSLLQTYKLVIE